MTPDRRGSVPDTDTRQKLFERRLLEARAVLLVERLWPGLVLAGAGVLLFLALAWLGLFAVLPYVARPLAVLLYGAGLAAALWAVMRGRWPGRAAALARLDRDTGLPHRLISSAQDRLADPSADEMTRALWAAHQKRIGTALGRLRLALPSPRLVDRDPYALRFAAVLVALAAAFAAGPERDSRLASAFDWRAAAAPAAGFRLDAWVDPPAYTGRPPVVLSGPGVNAGEDAVTAPAGSAIVIRPSGEGRIEIATEGGIEAAAPAPASTADARPAEAAAERRFRLKGDGRVLVTRDGGTLARYTLKALPDLPPTIAIEGAPVRNARGSLTLRYTIGDDYGVVGAEAAFSDPVLGGTAVHGRSLVPPPRVPLTLPAAPRGLGTGETTTDLADSPWAGATVTMVLSARDEGGNVGTSPPQRVVLPERRFTDPLARALVEQRRSLLLAPDRRDRLDTALDALTLAPDLFRIPPPVFLGLRTAKLRLDTARSDADLVAVADLLWAMALRIEDGDLSAAERDLKALQQELKDALARHSPPEEIRRLTQALRQALDKMLAEMARQTAKASPDGRRDPNGKSITPRDLQAMIDRMEQAARNGDVAEAERLLDQLRGVLDNLRSAERSGQQSQAGRQMRQAMSDLDRLMQDQQGLRDDTFRRGRQAGQPGAEGQPDDGQGGDAQDGRPSPGTGAMQDLEERQGALRRSLEAMKRRLRDMGLDGEKGLDGAEQAMKEAENALKQGADGADDAVGAQGRALRALQQGAQGLARQMAGQGSQDGQQGEGEDGSDGGGPDGQAMGGRDPLGRPLGERDLGLGDRQHPIGPGLAARAQQVLEELRRRLADPNRPQAEQDYLERLLRRY